MTLSYNKLEQLLHSQGLLPKSLFVMDGLLIYLEVYSIKNTDTFLLYIPKKYKIETGRLDNIYKLKYLELDNEGNLTDEYAGRRDDLDIETQYDEVDIGSSDSEHEDVVEHLEEKYNRPVSIKNREKDKKVVYDIFRQLRRLKFCTQNLKYKLGMIYKNYLCCINRKDDFDCFQIRGGYEVEDTKRLLISLDLETLYSRMNNLTSDIKTVREGVYRVLDKNQIKHAENLQRMFEQKKDIITQSDGIQGKKHNIIRKLDEFQSLLDKISRSEQDVIENMRNTKKQYYGLKGLHNDIERTRELSKYEEKLDKMEGIKRDIVKNITSLKREQENMMLKIDNILFDNSVMMDSISKNMKKLEELVI